MSLLNRVVRELKEIWAMITIAFTVGFVVGGDVYHRRRQLVQR